MELGLEELHRLADEYLPAEAAKTWKTLLAPGLRLKKADAGDLVVGQLGGLPHLNGQQWPKWVDHGPLSHVLTLECGPLAKMLPSAGLPTSGRLLFFYYDGPIDDLDISDAESEPDTRPEARVLYVDTAVEGEPTPAPKGAKLFNPVPLTAVTTTTWPTWEHPRLAEVWRALDEEAADDLYDKLDQLVSRSVLHQVGGHPYPIQNAVEWGAVEAELQFAKKATEIDWDDPALEQKTEGWFLLAQIDSDPAASMMWDDAGMLYFLIRPADLEATQFDWVSFVWQSH